MDACIGATCPFGQMCTAGQCVPTITPDAGMSTIDAFIPQNDASFRDGGPVMMMMDAGPAHDAAITHTPSRAASCGCRAGSARSGASALVLAALAMWIGKLRRR